MFLYAFDIIELNGDDLRHDPLEVRKATLASVVAKAGPSLRRHAAEQRDELASPHSITSSARASSVGGTSRPSLWRL